MTFRSHNERTEHLIRLIHRFGYQEVRRACVLAIRDRYRQLLGVDVSYVRAWHAKQMLFTLRKMKGR
jgi:hypothetical protein